MKIFTSLIFIIIIFFQYSCSTEPDDNYVPYKIRVDSITHPDTISVDDTLAIKFFGFVGPNGCHRFSHFEKHSTQNEFEFTVWGSRPDFETVCPAVMVWMNGTEYKTVIKQTGIYQIKIKQPDNTALIDTIFVQ